MLSWQKLALEYHELGMKDPDVARKIETEARHD